MQSLPVPLPSSALVTATVAVDPARMAVVVVVEVVEAAAAVQRVPLFGLQVMTAAAVKRMVVVTVAVPLLSRRHNRGTNGDAAAEQRMTCPEPRCSPKGSGCKYDTTMRRKWRTPQQLELRWATIARACSSFGKRLYICYSRRNIMGGACI